MTRILLVGNDGSSVKAGQGGGACIARTERFQQALSSNGFQVDVSSPDCREGISAIREKLLGNEYKCIVAISPHPAELAVLSQSSLPMWIDMNGMHLAEIHVSSDEITKPKLEMIRMLAMENLLLSRGDMFSAPSGRQACAILGELYLLGRFDIRSKNKVPVESIPHCAMPAPQSTGPAPERDEFSVISTGSFNAWFDEEILFKAIVYAMKRNPRITFTCTGGAIPFSEDKYRSFQQSVSDSEFRDRFRIAGWVDRGELERIQMTASAAVYTDISCSETVLGARTRVLDWISRGIPVACTDGAEISRTIADSGMGITVSSGESEALGEAFLKLASEPETAEQIKRSQASWRAGPGSMKTIFKPLIDWCSDPHKLNSVQLCSPTVPKISTAGYRKVVIREIISKAGYIKALGFLLKSLKEKFRSTKE